MVREVIPEFFRTIFIPFYSDLVYPERTENLTNIMAATKYTIVSPIDNVVYFISLRSGYM